MTAPMFDTPGSGELFRNEEHVGDLLVVKVLGTEEGIVTDVGTSDAIRADVTIVKDDGSVGDEYLDTLLFGRVLYGQLKRKTGRTVLGVFTGEPGVKRNGKNVAYTLDPASPEQTELAVRAMTGRPEPAQAANPAGPDSEGPAPTDLGDTPPWERKS
jgi:hypothetical protein